MFDQQYYLDLEKLNGLPLSQECLQSLQELNVQPERDSLYLLQLLEWALQSSELELDPKLRPVLQGCLESLFLADPKYALKYLLGSEEHPNDLNDLELSVQAWKSAKEPEDQASLLLDRLEHVLKSDPKYQAFFPPQSLE
jgi:hypothetical protein